MSTNPEKSPPIPADLPDHLAELFPDRCPSAGDSEADIWSAAGAAKVVRYLREELARQQALALAGRVTSHSGGSGSPAPSALSFLP